MENTDKKHIIGITYKQVDNKGWLRLDEWQNVELDYSNYEWIAVNGPSDKTQTHVYKTGDFLECVCCNIGHGHSESEHIMQVSKKHNLR